VTISSRPSDQIDRKCLGLALRHYTGNLHYRMSQKAGASRIDLDGNGAGTVSEADAASAARDVASRKAAFAERQRSEGEPEFTPAAPPPPRAAISSAATSEARQPGRVASGGATTEGNCMTSVGQIFRHLFNDATRKSIRLGTARAARGGSQIISTATPSHCSYDRCTDPCRPDAGN
jgi:sRNA-binding protein